LELPEQPLLAQIHKNHRLSQFDTELT